MTIAWLFVIAAVALAYLGPYPPTLTSPWHVASVLCAAAFLLLVIRGPRR